MIMGENIKDIVLERYKTERFYYNYFCIHDDEHIEEIIDDIIKDDNDIDSILKKIEFLHNSTIEYDNPMILGLFNPTNTSTHHANILRVIFKSPEDVLKVQNLSEYIMEYLRECYKYTGPINMKKQRCKASIRNDKAARARKYRKHKRK